ncbi:mitochondrial import inner membrane translocase [Striga asiatica]|uniref:Mitochondrial import inner membrane translocase n=1 Tax=Striga asiatica TaxID=4170 RepID=A0A5A7Q9I9_STRAF|nr:mitochondrial import inner membrane translocase [Striga asiatica]
MENVRKIRFLMPNIICSFQLKCSVDLLKLLILLILLTSPRLASAHPPRRLGLLQSRILLLGEKRYTTAYESYGLCALEAAGARREKGPPSLYMDPSSRNQDFKKSIKENKEKVEKLKGVKDLKLGWKTFHLGALRSRNSEMQNKADYLAVV